MTAIKSDYQIRSGRVFSRTHEASARRRLRPASPAGQADDAPELAAVVDQLRAENERLRAEADELRTLIGRSIRLIEKQNARLREHGLEPVAPAEIQI